MLLTCFSPCAAWSCSRKPRMAWCSDQTRFTSVLVAVGEKDLSSRYSRQLETRLAESSREEEYQDSSKRDTWIGV